MNVRLNVCYIKNVEGVGWSALLAGAMKYFRHKLIGHHIFLKLFDGPQKTFWRSSFPFFITVFFEKNYGGLNTKCLSCASRGFKKNKNYVKQQIKSTQIYDKWQKKCKKSLTLLLQSGPLHWGRGYACLTNILDKSLSVWLHFFRDILEY